MCSDVYMQRIVYYDMSISLLLLTAETVYMRLRSGTAIYCCSLGILLQRMLTIVLFTVSKSSTTPFVMNNH